MDELKKQIKKFRYDHNIGLGQILFSKITEENIDKVEMWYTRITESDEYNRYLDTLKLIDPEYYRRMNLIDLNEYKCWKDAADALCVFWSSTMPAEISRAISRQS